MTLPTVSAYSLRQTYAWATQEQLHWQIARLRTWLVGLLGTLRRDTWQSVEQLINLVYHLRRDPFQLDTGLPGWRWYRANAHVEPSQMAFEVWRDTYGKLIEAWLIGPASWLALVEVGQAGIGPSPSACRVTCRPVKPPRCRRTPCASPRRRWPC